MLEGMIDWNNDEDSKLQKDIRKLVDVYVR